VDEDAHSIISLLHVIYEGYMGPFMLYECLFIMNSYV